MVPPTPDRSVPSSQEIKPAKLLALLRQMPEPCPAVVTLEFQAMHRLVESLPLTSDEFCFAHNWLAAAQSLWQLGETNAAHYQVATVVRRLDL
jgi:hypothetical protein